jgi:hypothetical protein
MKRWLFLAVCLMPVLAACEQDPGQAALEEKPPEGQRAPETRPPTYQAAPEVRRPTYSWTPQQRAAEARPPMHEPSSQQPAIIPRHQAAPEVGPPTYMRYHQVVRHVQQELQKQGYNPGKIDGKMGPRTRSTLKRYQTDHGLPATGEIDSKILETIVLRTTQRAR